jgi:hypothetical protein
MYDHFLFLFIFRFEEISQFLQVYGVKEFLSNLSGICRDSSIQPERRGQSDENSFYAFMQNRKSAIVQSFSSRPSQDQLDMSSTTGSIYAASTDTTSYAVQTSKSADFTSMNHRSPLIGSTLGSGGPADSDRGYKKGPKLSSLLGEDHSYRMLSYCV